MVRVGTRDSQAFHVTITQQAPINIYKCLLLVAISDGAYAMGSLSVPNIGQNTFTLFVVISSATSDYLYL